MKGIALKSLALVILIAFGFMLVPQQADAQINWQCLLLSIACAAANEIADEVCKQEPVWCDLAREIARIICDAAAEACG